MLQADHNGVQYYRHRNDAIAN